MVDVLDPKPEDIDIQDVAHALSRVARFTGHTSGPRGYSVAQHSVLVALVAMLDAPPAAAVLAARLGLLHDASEAYLADVARPLKHHPSMAPYRAAEARLELAVLARFGLPARMGHDPQPHGCEASGSGCVRCAAWESVSRADAVMLATEAQALMAPLAPGEWGGLPEVHQGVLGLVDPWEADEARDTFLGFWAELESGRPPSILAELNPWAAGPQVTG